MLKQNFGLSSSMKLAPDFSYIQKKISIVGVLNQQAVTETWVDAFRQHASMQGIKNTLLITTVTTL